MAKNLTRYAVILFPVVAGLIGLVFGLTSAALSQKEYTATNAVLVVGNTQAQGSGQASDVEALIQSQMQNFEYLVTSPLVLEPALKKSGLSGSIDDMPGVVKGSATLNTSILEVTVVADTPEVAAKLANATQDSLIAAVATYGPQAANGKPVLVAHEVSRSTLPDKASSPNPMVNALTGGLVGLAIGMAASKLLSWYATATLRVSGQVGARRSEED